MPRSLRPLTMQSLAVTAVATSRMHTSLSRGRGSGTVLIWSTSGGPYAVQTAALIFVPCTKSAPGGNRTPDLDVRTVLLYPLSYGGAPRSLLNGPVADLARP